MTNKGRSEFIDGMIYQSPPRKSGITFRIPLMTPEDIEEFITE